MQFRITPQHIANVCVNWERFRNRLHKIWQKRIKKYTPKRLTSQSERVTKQTYFYKQYEHQYSEKSEEKYLKIDIQTKKGIMLIHVKNSYSGRIIETGNKIQTSQKEVAIHGIGLENVKKIVKSNGGEIEIGYTENYFEVKILLYLSNIK